MAEERVGCDQNFLLAPLNRRLHELAPPHPERATSHAPPRWGRGPHRASAARVGVLARREGDASARIAPDAGVGSTGDELWPSRAGGACSGP